MMNVEMTDRVNLKEEVKASEAEFGKISSLLIEFQRMRASGVVRVNTVLGQDFCKRVFLFQNGWIVYAGKEIPEPREFLTEISQHLQGTILQEALDFAAKRQSVQKVVRALVKVKLVDWSDITRAVRLQTLALLEELDGVSGRATLDASATPFDLHYEDGTPGFAVDKLLSELENRARESQASDERPVVLSVDDSPIAHAMVERHLGENYQVVSCETATDALAVLDRERDTFRFMLLDLTLPDIDGLDVCKIVRKRFEDLPIVLLTSRNGIADRVRGCLAGANHFLAKPCSPQELRDVLATEEALVR